MLPRRSRDFHSGGLAQAGCKDGRMSRRRGARSVYCSSLLCIEPEHEISTGLGDHLRDVCASQPVSLICYGTCVRFTHCSPYHSRSIPIAVLAVNQNILKFRRCPSTPVMDLIPTREQVLAFPQLIPACCRDAGREQCVGRPGMSGQAGRQRRGHRTPRARRTGPSCGCWGRQGCWQPLVWTHQRVRGQRYPPRLFTPRQVLGKAMRATGEAPMTRAWCEVSAFDKARLHRLAAWRGRQGRRHALLGPTHPSCAPLHSPPCGALLDHLRLPQAGGRPTAGGRRAPRVPCRAG